MKKSLILTLFIVVLFNLLSMNVYPYVVHNGSGKGYDGGGGGGDSKVNNYCSIEYYIIEGASYYLSAAADIKNILKIIELKDINGIDFNSLNILVDSAIENMINTQETYDNLITEAESTPYDENIQRKLKEFGYDTFMIENGLISSLFEEVEIYLKVGDITGVYIWTQSNFTDILNMLKSIQNETSQNSLPEVSIFRRLNDTCSKTSIFGSYVARVFHTLVSNNQKNN